MTYSLDMRKKILKIRHEEGLSMAKVAKRFGVGVASVMRWSKNIECIKKRNRSTKIDMEALKKDVETYPDAYQSERAGRLGVSEYCVWYALKRLGVTYKKKPSITQRRIPKDALLFAPRWRNIRTSAGLWCFWMSLVLPTTCHVYMATLPKEVVVLGPMTGVRKGERM